MTLIFQPQGPKVSHKANPTQGTRLISGHQNAGRHEGNSLVAWVICTGAEIKTKIELCTIFLLLPLIQSNCRNGGNELESLWVTVLSFFTFAIHQWNLISEVE